ncbi:MAG: PD-(D/E)XK nuclease family protein [Treponema sp.]|nr:PD-(D/E)XK nuclease family protein [Treponema sp.]
MDEVNRLSNLLNSITTIETDSVNAACELLLCTKTIYSDHKDDVIKQYDLTRDSKFNIFETISDLYKREKFHSDILFTILDSNTPEIGPINNKEILEEFVKMVDNSFDFKVDNTVKVSKEESNKVLNGDYEKQGYIDLLITNAHNKAIIIENKINDAPDMDNQLVRYMKYVKEQLFKNDKDCDIRVVYLTLVPGKIPNIDEYDDSFAEYKEMLSDAKSGKDGKILKYRYAVDSCKDKPDLVTFLTNCIEFFGAGTDDKSLLKKIYLEQYKTLLGHLGGNAAMLEYQKDLLEEIYSSPEKLKAAKDLVEVFNEESLKMYINDRLRPLLENKEMGFAFEDNCYYKVWNNDHTLNLYVTGQCGFQIGFWANKNFTEDEKQEYIKILENAFEEEFKSVKIERDYEDSWVCLIIKPLAGKTNMDEFLKYYTNFIPQIKKEFQKTQV